jgi:hypothetical protein
LHGHPAADFPCVDLRLVQRAEHIVNERLRSTALPGSTLIHESERGLLLRILRKTGRAECGGHGKQATIQLQNPIHSEQHFCENVANESMDSV